MSCNDSDTTSLFRLLDIDLIKNNFNTHTPLYNIEYLLDANNKLTPIDNVNDFREFTSYTIETFLEESINNDEKKTIDIYFAIPKCLHFVSDYWIPEFNFSNINNENDQWYNVSDVQINHKFAGNCSYFEIKFSIDQNNHFEIDDFIYFLNNSNNFFIKSPSRSSESLNIYYELLFSNTNFNYRNLNNLYITNKNCETC
jgi:hypothetical protein